MIHALYQVGMYCNTYSSRHSIEELIDKIKSNDYKLLLIGFKDKEDYSAYEGVEIEDFTAEKNIQIAYKKGSSRGGNITPSQIIDLKDPAKSLRNFILPIQKLKSPYFIRVTEFLNTKENFERVLEDIKKHFSLKEKYIISLKLNDKFMSEYQEVIIKLETNSLDRYKYRVSFPKEDQYSVAQNKLCYICNEVKEEVLGFVNTYNFYTLDKPGFMVGGFKQKNAWKNYPVCPSCALQLEKGRKYVEEYLSESFAGLTYIIFPKFLFDISSNTNQTNYIQLMKGLVDSKDISLSNKKRDGLISGEDRILQRISKLDNILTAYIMFYNANNSEFKILQNIEDVYPSRLRMLFEVKSQIEENEQYIEFQNLTVYKNTSKEKTIEFKMNFSIAKEFFKKDIEQNEYLQIIHDIFIGRYINEKNLISKMIAVLRDKHNREEFTDITAIHSLLILTYLSKLGLLKNKSKGGTMEMNEIKGDTRLFQEFLERQGAILNSNAKCASFLVGVLVKRLMDIQFDNLGSRPFYERLNGLKLNEKTMMKIFNQMENKFTEYKNSKSKINYKDLKELASEYLVQSDFKQLTNDEISYYFVLGMNLEKKFKGNKNDL